MPEGMTRSQHLAWCKDRAISEVNFTSDFKSGIISMMVDLRKHPETNDEVFQALCMREQQKANLTKQGVINFINGFR